MSGQDQDDHHLILEVAQGSPGALATLYERHERAVWSVARAFARDPSEVDDLVQETFLAVLRSASTYRPGESARAWLYAIARNAGRRSHRRDREVPEPSLLELGVEAGWGSPDHALGREADANALAWAIASLGPRDREIVLLRDVEGLSGEECAAALALSVAAMKSRLHRARLRLLAALRADEGGVVANESEVGGLVQQETLHRAAEREERHTASPRRSASSASSEGASSRTSGATRVMARECDAEAWIDNQVLCPSCDYDDQGACDRDGFCGWSATCGRCVNDSRCSTIPTECTDLRRARGC